MREWARKAVGKKASATAGHSVKNTFFGSASSFVDFDSFTRKQDSRSQEVIARFPLKYDCC